MEQLTKKEQDQLKRLQSKQKRIERAEKDFWVMVDERKAEVLEHYGISRPTSTLKEGPRNYGERSFDAH